MLDTHCPWCLLSRRLCREWIHVYTHPRIVDLDAGFDVWVNPTSPLFQVVLMTTWSKEVKWNSYASRERGTSPSSSSPSSGTATPLNIQAVNKMHQMKLMRMWFCGWGAFSSAGMWSCFHQNNKSIMAIWHTDTNNIDGTYPASRCVWHQDILLFDTSDAQK